MDVYVDTVKRNIAGRGVAARVEEGEEEQYIKAFQDISKVETSSVYGMWVYLSLQNSKLPPRRRVSHAAARPRPGVCGQQCEVRLHIGCTGPAGEESEGVNETSQNTYCERYREILTLSSGQLLRAGAAGGRCCEATPR